MHREAGNGILLHLQVPELDCHVVSRQQVASVSAKANIRNTADDLREKRAGPGLQQVTEALGQELVATNPVTLLMLVQISQSCVCAYLRLNLLKGFGVVVTQG